MTVFRCDMCGVELERHGERYLMRIERVPAWRMGVSAHMWDLCPDCAEQTRVRMEKGDGDGEVRD